MKVPVAHLTNGDLPIIINRKPGQPVEKRPFDYCFTEERIFGAFLAIGFIPFTRQALKHKKVCHMLGMGGASKEMTKKLETTNKRYALLKAQVSEEGLNAFVFDARIPVCKKHPSLQKNRR